MTKKKKLTLQQRMYEDRMTAEDIANLSDQRPTRINVFKRASKIKTWNMFNHLVEQENITPAEALTIILKHVKKSWNKYKILREGDHLGAILGLLELQGKLGAYKLYHHKYLNDFCAWTGYKKTTFDTFQNNLTTFRYALGIGKKNTGAFTKNRKKKESASRARSGRKPFNYMERMQEQIDAGYVMTEYGWKIPQK